jgi:hypothetical protein
VKLGAKQSSFKELHGIISLKMELFTITAMRTSKPTKLTEVSKKVEAKYIQTSLPRNVYCHVYE